MYRYQLMTQGQIGKLFGVSSHQIGKWLQEIGLRTEDGKPSRASHEGKFCDTAPSRGQGYCWAWRPGKTIPALEQGGHRRVFPPPLDLVEVPALNGPFTMRRAGNGMTEIVNGDGTVATFVLGEENAELVCRFLNVAHRLGKVGPEGGTQPDGEAGKADQASSAEVQSSAGPSTSIPNTC